MTAPALPAPAPVEQPIAADSPFAIDQVIASISSDAVAQTMAEQAPDPAEQPRRPDGTFAPKPKAEGEAGEVPPVVDPAAAVAVDPNAEPAPVVLPDGMVAVPTITGREPATKFRVLDHEGELELPDISIEFTGNGKQRTEPLDKVVRLAERGIYNEEREQAVLQARSESQAIQQQNQQLVAYAQRLEQERQTLLSSDEAYLTARAQYDAENTPAMQVQRANEQRQAAEQQSLYTQARVLSNQYFEQSVLPAVNTIAEKMPTVTADEIGARLVLLTNHLRIQTPDGDTFIPPAKREQVNQIILRDIVPWVASLHEDRDQQHRTQRDASTRETETAKAQARQAQIDAQKARSLLGRQGKPGKAGASSGSNTAGTREATPQKPITNIDEAQDAALDATFEAMGLERPRGS